MPRLRADELIKLILKTAVVFLSAFQLSCGLDDYYYLPQVPPSYVTSSMTSTATIIIPRIDQDYYYANYYSIYYKIYIGADRYDDSATALNNVNPELIRDYNAIFPNTDPTNTTAGTSVNSLFRNRNYYELRLENGSSNYLLPASGGTLTIRFPTSMGDYPVAVLNDGPELRLSRPYGSGIGELLSPLPRNDPYFRNTPELNDNENAVSEVNADVSGRSGISQRYAYVSMYIVAVGYDNALFTQIYSRPTFINIFKLPDMN